MVDFDTTVKGYRLVISTRTRLYSFIIEGDTTKTNRPACQAFRISNGFPFQKIPETRTFVSTTASIFTSRAAISPGGDFLYVTARASDAVLVYDTSRMVSDPAHALVARVPTGKAPVGITIADSGKKLLVANSDRFGGGAHQTVTVIDATRVSSGEGAVLGTTPAQSFPREFASSPDGTTIFLSNFNSNSLEIIDAAKLPKAP